MDNRPELPVADPFRTSRTTGGHVLSGVSYNPGTGPTGEHPGILAQSVLTIAIFQGIMVIWERDQGSLQKYLVSPMPRSALVLGKGLGSGMRGALLHNGRRHRVRKRGRDLLRDVRDRAGADDDRREHAERGRSGHEP